MSSLRERQIGKQMDRMFGETDPELKEVVKLTLLNGDDNDAIEETVADLRHQHDLEYEEIIQHPFHVHDANGNLVPITDWSQIFPSYCICPTQLKTQ